MNRYEKLGVLIDGLITKETHVTIGKENSIIEGETYAIKVNLIYNQGRSIAAHKETFTERALDNMGDPHVVADAILNKLKNDVKAVPRK